MKNDRIRVGLIGANPDRGWAMGVHIPALQALPHFEMTAVGTTRQETAEAAAKKWGVRGAYTDPRQLAADPDVDLVVVSVKTPGHHALVRTALEAGKHVLCEWPLAATMDEVRDLVGLARAARCPYLHRPAGARRAGARLCQGSRGARVCRSRALVDDAVGEWLGCVHRSVAH